jgi:hypothetical protein
MKINLNVKKVTVMTGLHGPDQVDLLLDMPPAFPECGYDGVASIKTRQGYGIQWCRENLGIEPEVIRTGT